MKDTLDLFSEASESYLRFRPEYPEELFNWILKSCRNRDTAWDCATGNGQVAKVLAQYFNQVAGSDISEHQLHHAHKADNIFYARCRSEETAFFDSSFDLITVAQAFHWFDQLEFSKEVNRLLRPEGILAIWGYHLLRVNPKVNALIDHFYYEVVGPYWADERLHVENRYEDIFVDMPLLSNRDDLFIEADWNRDQLLGYLATWSASKTFATQQKNNPILEIRPHIEKAWKADEVLTVRFPLFAKKYKKI